MTSTFLGFNQKKRINEYTIVFFPEISNFSTYLNISYGLKYYDKNKKMMRQPMRQKPSIFFKKVQTVKIASELDITI